jgi:cobalt-zinc-cadmium efflux system protein
MLTDVAALALAWWAAVQAKRPADARRTYGYARSGILAALVNAVALIVVTLWIVFEAIRRLGNPEAVQPAIMMATAAAGLVLNAVIGLKILHVPHNHVHARQFPYTSREGSHASPVPAEDDTTLNERAAWLHVMGDAAASLGVIVGGAVIALTGWAAIDPLVSIGIGVLIAIGAWRILSETVDVLMEGTPRGIDVREVLRTASNVPGVLSMHDLHIWTVANGSNALSAHVVVDNQLLSQADHVAAMVEKTLHERFAIGHATLQLECGECRRGDDGMYCAGPLQPEAEPVRRHEPTGVEETR